MYSIIFIKDDKMDMKNFINFHEMMNFVIDIITTNPKVEFLIRNEKGGTIYKYARPWKEY